MPSGAVPDLHAGIPYNTAAVALTLAMRDSGGGMTNGPEAMSQITCSGSIKVKWNSQTAGYSIIWGDGGDHLIYANTTGGSITLNLPAPATVGAGGMLRLIRPSASNTLTLALNAGEKINGVSANKTIAATAFLIVEIFCDGTDWIVGSHTVV